jgi:diguanylate cyclase (GGDEF)-like protein
MLEKEIASAQMSEQLVTVVMFDIDYFKTYNDRFGHPAGDAMLREISRYLQQHTFSHESPCLYGGDEFFAILPGTTLPEAAARASGWQKEINHITLKYEGQEIGNVTLSIGVASFPENGNSSIEIMKAVDVALYQAKTDGRNRLVIAKTAGIESIGKN